MNCNCLRLLPAPVEWCCLFSIRRLSMCVVWHGGNINKVQLRQVRLELDWIGDHFWQYYSVSSALPSLCWSLQWVLAMISATTVEKRLVLHSRRPCNQDCLHKPKFHLARHVLTRSTCWAHAFWLCLACRTARRTRLAQHVERVELCRDVTWGAKWDLGYTGWSRSIWTGRPANVGFPIFTQCDSVHIAADSKEVTLLIVLDLSGAFDTVCHSTLTKRLQTEFGVSGAALSWIQSYL